MPRRASTLPLQFGLIAVVLAALTYKVFELDRYFVPKELVLHAAAVVAAVPLLFARRTDRAGRIVDLLLAVFLAWSVLSALFATSYWLAQRAVALSASSLILFWSARRLGAAGLDRPIIIAAAVATVCAVATGLAQAYGAESVFFSLNRAPGGTFGNRNFVAHVAAIGLPALIYTVITARTAAGALVGTLATGAVAALLILTRSRAAWLAVAMAVAVSLVALFAARCYWRDGPTGGRLARIALTAVVFVVAATVLPNDLNWRSDSPYLESAMRVADYSSGSGRGRLAQYRNSLSMTAANPLFGVGPGNWPVEYTEFAPGNDPSLAADGMPANPWPSSDWVAHVSERGPVAAVALAVALALLFAGAFRRWPTLGAADANAVLAKITLAATIAATAVVSAFDAVLLLAAPAFLAWVVIGALAGVGARDDSGAPPPRWYRFTLIGAAVLAVTGVARSAAQVASIVTVGAGGSSAAWVNAARWDPGSYRIALRAAQLQAARGRCEAARAHATRARSIFPHAAAPRAVLRRCG